MTGSRFPVGGPRAPVYAFLSDKGWAQTNCDKHYVRNGMVLHLYGAGSRARIFRNGEQVADGPLEETVNANR